MAKKRKPYIYEYVKVLSIRDGDTFNADIDLGGRTHSFSGVRFKGINTPELDDPDVEQAKIAEESKKYLELLLPPGTMVRIESKRLDLYGRFESIVFNEKGENLNLIVAANLKKKST